MALRHGARALARLAPAACDGLALHLQASLPACTQAAASWNPQQLVSLYSYAAPRGFAASAAAASAAAAAPAPAAAPPAAAAASQTAQATPSAAAPAAAAAAGPQHPEVYVRLAEGVAERYTVQPKAVFAVVEVGGTQYKVTPGDVIIVEKLADVDVNDKLQLQRVLLLGSRAETIIGRPYIPAAAVTAAVEEQFLDGKVLIFHKRRRKNSRRLRGHRQPLTTLRILDVHGIAEAEGEVAAAESAAAVAAQ